MLAAVARAAGCPEAAVRRALTLAGDLGAVAVTALTSGADGLAAFGLRVGTPLAPMLAGSAPSLAAALERTGPAGVEWKLDGIRVQVHRDGDDVRVFTRSLDEITDRMPEVVAAVLAGVPEQAVLDGEVIALRPDGRPQPFQVTGSRTATRSGSRRRSDRHAADAVRLRRAPPGRRRPARRARIGTPSSPRRRHRPGPARAEVRRRATRPTRPRWRPPRPSRPMRWPGATRVSSSRPTPRRTPWGGAAPAGSRSSRCTPSTWSSWPSSGAMGGAPASCPTCTWARWTRRGGSGRRAAS